MAVSGSEEPDSALCGESGHLQRPPVQAKHRSPAEGAVGRSDRVCRLAGSSLRGRRSRSCWFGRPELMKYVVDVCVCVSVCVCAYYV